MLLAEIERFLNQTGMPPTTFGVTVMNDWHLVRRLRDGGSVRMPTADKIREFISNYPREKTGGRSEIARPLGRAANNRSRAA